MNMNKVILAGNLGTDPVTRYTDSGRKVTSLSMATNRYWLDEGVRHDSTEWHSIVFWGRLAEIAEQYLSTGSNLMVVGRLQTRSWTDEDEVKHYRTEVVGEELQLGSRPTPSDAVEIPDPSTEEKAAKPRTKRTTKTAKTKTA